MQAIVETGLMLLDLFMFGLVGEKEVGDCLLELCELHADVFGVFGHE